MESPVEQCRKYSRALLRKVRSLFSGRSQPPEDPFSYVTAPGKPRPPYLRAAAVAELPDE